MTAVRSVAAVDLGAESGRVARVEWDGERLRLGDTTRFEHLPARDGDRLRWDVDGLWSRISQGLAALGDDPPASVGVDAWGVDYGLYGADGALLEAPACYRSPERVAAFDSAIARWGADPFYAATGIQVMPINTAFGLLADREADPERFARAQRILMLPDVFHRMLSGATVTEYTVASTSGILDMRTGKWSRELADLIELPPTLLPEVARPGTEIGTVRGALADAGLGHTRVILPAAHDTASAVLAGVDRPATTLYISSGTWSLVGVTRSEPIVTARSEALNVTNEGGYADTIRLLMNVMGLWIVQECRRQWRREGVVYDYAELVRLAADETRLRSVIDVNSPALLPPGDMPARIRDHCHRAGQPVPQGPGAVIRTAIDSLALGYRRSARLISELTGEAIREVAVIGGGSRNGLLQQATADAIGVPVVCGPVEGTALGNAAVQLAALGEFRDPAELGAAIRASEPSVRFEPRDTDPWDEAAAELDRIVAAR